MAFVKLDCGILNSTLWVDRPARELFITALLMAEPREYIEPEPQIEIQSLNLTGWCVPPGWYGFVPAAGVGIINRAGIDSAAGYAALERMSAPELDSRSPEFEGRRLVRVNGGFVVLNYFRYRDRDHTAADRQRRLRLRKRGGESTRNGVTSRIADADADAEKIKMGSPSESPVGAARPKLATRLPDDFALTPERRAIAVKEGVDPDRTFLAFRNYWLAKGGQNARKHDWDATWTNWCMKEADSHGNHHRGPSRPQRLSAPERVRRATGVKL